MNKKLIKLFVPGRLCLFGEHSDWAGKYRTMNADIIPGMAIVTGVEQGIEATAETSDCFEVTSTAPELNAIWKDFSCEMNSLKLKEIARSGSFFSYCAGVASYMMEWYNVGGVKINITSMTLPIKSGLSSSAAICVIVARAFNLLYNLNLNTLGEMNIAYVGELRTSSRCGRLDQACAFGVKPVQMIFDGEEMEVKPLTVGKELYWVFADLCAKKDTIRILTDLNKGYPFPSSDKEVKEHWALGEGNQEIILRAIQYIRDGEEEKLGLLMTEAQRLFDETIAPLCPMELTAPKLHSILSDDYVKTLTYGGKGVGSQGDGSIQFLAKNKDCQVKLIEYLYQIGLRPYPLTIKAANKVRKAIIPVAGFGTRLYPATRYLKKDFFPIVDRDGLVKPVIMILLEELVNSGVEEICIVLGSEDERKQYQEFFEKRISLEHFDKLNKESQEYEGKILNIGKRLRYVYQKEKLGFGHAVYQCKEFANGEPVILLLGDTLYHSYINKPCAQQLIEAYNKYNKPMVSIHDIPLNMVSHYGIVSGLWENKEETILNMSSFTEKPKASYAEEYLGVKTKDNNTRYYSVFGQYILTNEVFEQLNNNIKKYQGKGEIELTTALEQVRQKVGMLGVRLEGRMFDMGNAKAFVTTISEYSNKPIF